MAIKHTFVSAKADGPDPTEVNPSNWNDNHQIDPGTIGTTELADLSVTTAKLADGSVTQPKLAVGITAIDEEMRQVYGITALFNVALNTAYAEYTYAGSRLTQVDVWETVAKVTKLYTRTLSYTGPRLTSRVTLDEQSGTLLTENLTYTGTRLATSTATIS